MNKTDKSVKVSSPDGYHWMTEGGRHFLMKGAYKPHSGASKEAPFRVVSHAPSEDKTSKAMDYARQAKK